LIETLQGFDAKMIKRTIVISQRSYIFHKDEQLHIRQKDGGQVTMSVPEGADNDGETGEQREEATVPIEDIGVVILESHQSTISTSALNALMENNCVVIGCDNKHTPNSVMYPISGNVLHTAVLKTQLKTSVPLMKQLWQQTIKAKLLNQAAVLASRGINAKPMELWARKVRSGDAGNLEGRGAAYYWKRVFTNGSKTPSKKSASVETDASLSTNPPAAGLRSVEPSILMDGAIRAFTRDPEGEGPNSALNYGYAILRAAMARAIVGSGLHPSIGLHHKNQYNPFCLADDLMEPYRPFVDLIVLQICEEQGDEIDLSTENKKKLLSILAVDTFVEAERKPLMLALTATTASLVRCFAGDAKRVVYPELGANNKPEKEDISHDL
jgi:CRISPR-associated protein Cas1